MSVNFFFLCPTSVDQPNPGTLTLKFVRKFKPEKPKTPGLNY